MTDTADCEFFGPSCDPASFWLYLSISLLLVCAAGLMAGLTMGLLSLDMLNMRILEMEGTEEQKEQAARVLPFLSQHHFLLVTLLLVNAGANEALPIFLSKLMPEATSIIFSVTCVLLFGEIIPSAVFTGPNQLRIAAALTPVVRVLMLLASPLAYPISKVLDLCLGADHDPAKYKRRELKALIALQRENNAVRRNFIDTLRSSHEEPSHTSSLQRTQSSLPAITPRAALAHNKHQASAQGTQLLVDEVTIIHGALDLSSKTVKEVMIPMDDVYMLEYETKLDDNTMADILASGHSRIPVYREYDSNIVGLLLVKRLIVVDPDDCRPVCDMGLRKPIVVDVEESCYSILNEFQKGRSHIALVTSHPRLVMKCWDEGKNIPPEVKFLGIVTIEDVIEELIQEEIEDESDLYVNDIVKYWKKRSKKAPLHSPAGHKNFVNKKLHLLAERARRRVKNRRSKHQPAPGHVNRLDAPIHVKVVSEKTPLFLQS